MDQSASRPWKVHTKPSSQSAKLIPNGSAACRKNVHDSKGRLPIVTDIVDDIGMPEFETHETGVIG